MALERDDERAYTIRPVGRSEIQQLSVGENDTSRVLFSPGGNQTTQGAAGAFYSALWFSTPLGAMEMKVDNAGVITYTAGTSLGATTGRWPTATRFDNPTTRVAAPASLALRGPGDNYAEFFVTPRAGMQLCDSAGVGWRFVVNAGGTAFAAPTSVTLAAQQASLGNPTWFRADGRTTIGSRSGIGGSLRVESYASAVQVRWNALATDIYFLSPNKSVWKVTPDNTGVLTVTAVP